MSEQAKEQPVQAEESERDFVADMQKGLRNIVWLMGPMPRTEQVNELFKYLEHLNNHPTLAAHRSQQKGAEE